MIKVMTYNVLHGFHKSSPPFEFEKDRLALAKKIVSEQNPDVLVLTEACYGKEFKGSFVDYQREFGFPHHYHANRDCEHGVSLLSRFPITQADNFSFNRAHFLRAKIDLEGKVVNVDVVHPHPSLSEDEKARFIRSVLRDFKTPYILAGDFNAVSPRDNYDKDDMIRSFSRFSDHARETVERLLTFRMIGEVERLGLIDTYTALHKDDVVNFTAPTDLLSTDKGSGMRCDYIFCSDDFSVEDAGVIKSPDTEKASDHHPIYAILNLRAN